MRRAVAYILALCFAVLGTGVVQHLHDLQHAAKPQCVTHDQSFDPAKKIAPRSAPGNDRCALCLLLHQPLVAYSLAPTAVLTLDLTGRHEPMPVLVVKVVSVDAFHCRGPPSERSQIV